MELTPRDEHVRPAARSNGRLAGWLIFVGTLTLLNYSGRYLGDARPPSDFVYLYSTAVATVIQFGLMLGIVLLIARRAPTRELLGLRRPRSWGVALGLGLGLLVAVYVFIGAAGRLLDPGDEQGLVPTFWDPDRLPQFALNVALIAIFVPIVEEVMFRGLGWSLLARFGDWPATAITALLFALGHGLVRALPIFVAFGLGLGWLRSRTRSVYPPIVVHGVFNAIALIAAVALAGRGTG